ncbi:hypothetical protein Vqi01_49160 [Micromonospora qiuiae]|uniref:Helix-hairpin-helix domain-containing protein n=1 Tax=Micromonospora qiuiae TaxID=502268 RepID=A0ABQ4JJQ2_9ACTN|nr:helix-hairpin-helix domain-containing protein [Micromonospora qiuiae]GIJ29754.1 hypothetical protein Vqi01_49160 [Micromonospora qiuiae]
MSSAPDPGRPSWGQPPVGQPQPPAASFKWRLMHSWWLLLPVLGMSCLGGLGFLYVGLRARRPAWWIAGIGYLLVGWTAFILAGESDPDAPLGDWMAGLVLVVWLTSIVHAAMINSSWLRWRAGYRPWYAQQPAPGGPGYPPGTLAPPPGASPPAPPFGASPPAPPFPGVGPAAPPFPGVGPAAPPFPGAGPAAPPAHPPTGFPPAGSTSDYFGSGPVAAPVPIGGEPRRLDVAAAPLDVNAARPEEFAALPGLDPQRVRQALAERDRRGGFGSVSEFVAAAGLAPHEYARLRDNLVCSPPVRPASGLPPQGRVLDV